MLSVRNLGTGFGLAALSIYVGDASTTLEAIVGRVGALGADTWRRIHPHSLDAIEAAVRTHALTFVSDPNLRSLLEAPAWLVFGGAGLVVLGLDLALRRRPAKSSSHRDGVEQAQIQKSSPATGTSPRSELLSALAACRSAFLGIGLFSGVSNILMLTGSFYMLEIYDRVLASRSIPTLVAISLLAGAMFAAQGVIDLIRGRLLVRIGASLDETLSPRVYNAVVRLPLKTGQRSDGLQPLSDLVSIRAFLSGLGPTALFDMPWMPLYLIIIFAFHPLLGVTALGGALFLVTLTALTEILTHGPAEAATVSSMARNRLAEASRRNAEVLVAMGFAGPMEHRWGRLNQSYMIHQQRVSDVSGGIGAFSKVLRMMLQSAMLGLGAYLVIHQEATAGIIIAGSILSARALAPADLAIAHWKGFVAARQSWQRLDKLLKLLPLQDTPMALPAPKGVVMVEGVGVAPPGTNRVVVQDVSFALKSGQGLGIIGPSASGKSSLARMLVGVWQPLRGKIRIDGAALDQWSPDVLGQHIGYLPQDVELFAGTVAENIARFDPRAEPSAIIAAAQAAGVHDLVVGLPNGYETEIGDQGSGLSAGQQQRIALARALYGDPFLVVLDEPNSNMDSEGEAALTHSILGIRKRGGIVVVIAHRPSALAGVDLLIVMNQGRAQAFGPKDEVLSKMVRPGPATPLKIVPEGARS